MPETHTLKVSNSSNPGKVASSIEKGLMEGKDVETITIGAGALNQAVKGFIIARGHVITQGIDFDVRHSFTELSLGEEKKIRTAICTRTIRVSE